MEDIETEVFSIDKARLIRRRNSYAMFKNIIEAHYCGVEELLMTLHKTLDDRRNFGTQSNSDHALESIKQLIRDCG